MDFYSVYKSGPAILSTPCPTGSPLPLYSVFNMSAVLTAGARGFSAAGRGYSRAAQAPRLSEYEGPIGGPQTAGRAVSRARLRRKRAQGLSDQPLLCSGMFPSVGMSVPAMPLAATSGARFNRIFVV
ncbi:hypothetical protein AAFF_G00267920 [Aldrovandia affinis]|uniref:Uncharacterized protein n=1 Tax=Aldrovandia affinis TaxID=143900 RepID=A0AAD7ST92_9TELE|nr:hypothetical protein AAFF_G00267920 [Aldrovandia affinis]